MSQPPKPLKVSYGNKDDRFRMSEPTHKVPITAMFLCQFDVKKGNCLVWSQTCAGVSDEVLFNIEFKCLPSGIHELDQDVVHFVVPKKEGGKSGFYYGVSSYQQNGLFLAGDSSHVDRSQVEMFSLGVIVDPAFRNVGVSRSKFYDWKPNQLVSASEYIDDLQRLLSHWRKSNKNGDFEVFEEFFDSNCLKDDLKGLSSPVLQRKWQNAGKFISDDSEPERHPHMLENLTRWVSYLGPLIYPLWKASLMRERILIVGGSGVSFDKCDALTYCLSILSLIPRSLEDKLIVDPLQPLFSIGITDTDFLTELVSQALNSDNEDYQIPGFLACTTDEILEFKPELYDILFKVNDQQGIPEIRKADSSQVKATPHELEAYQYLMQTKMGYSLSAEELQKINKLVEPTSWSQYLIDGFYWWATAGYMKPSYHENEDKPLESADSENIEVVVALVGYFHEKTCLIFQKLRQVIENSDDPSHVIIPAAFLGEVGLDCFSVQDYEFIEKLARKWFQVEVQVSQVDMRLLC
ncbi:LAMI_0C10748g1_1 [Lachancea mirantina]|uniref:LAMI_0C10748g1_1 n=1 Tax=Lachancea mirantina TaxID=1230905 RepID=A0A1G4J630_9SACH|nr:LAMI_0C10748g1_1 [Lachancea mirantina]